MVNGVFTNSVQFWKATLISKIIFITNLITVDFYLMSAVKLSLISVVPGKSTSSISRLSAERDDSLLLFLVVAPKDSRWAPYCFGHSSHTANRKYLLQRSCSWRQLI